MISRRKFKWKGAKKLSQIKFTKQRGMKAIPELLEPLSNIASARQSFQLSKLRHNFSSTETTPKVEVITLVLWDSKISLRGKKTVYLVKLMTNSGITPINNENWTTAWQELVFWGNLNWIQSDQFVCRECQKAATYRARSTWDAKQS